MNMRLPRYSLAMDLAPYDGIHLSFARTTQSGVLTTPPPGQRFSWMLASQWLWSNWCNTFVVPMGR